jgi:hypothetical protein
MRNRDGLLTVDALKQGAREQYANVHGGRHHSVVLAYRPIPGPLHWVVTHKITSSWNVIESHEWNFRTVDEARTLWRARVRKHTKS